MSLKEIIESKLTEEIVLEIYKEFQGQETSIGNGQYRFLCPFHNDTKESLNVTPSRMGVYHCFVCESKGNLYTFLASKDIKKPLIWLAERLGVDATEHKKQIIPPGEILEAHQLLYKAYSKLQQLMGFGISGEVIKKRMLGFNKERFYFPIPDEIGDFVNIRMYQPGNKEKKVISYGKGFGEARLFPIENLRSDTIYIMEGEKDCLVAESYGYNAVTVTGGAGTWNSKWNGLFKNKNVIIVGDVDAPGLEGAMKKAVELYPHAGQVKIIKLPLDINQFPTGDFTDYMSSAGGTKESFNKLVEDTEVFVPEGQANEESEIRCLLADATKSSLINKRCYMSNIMINGRDRSPFSVPKSIEWKCLGGGEACAFCNIQANESKEIVLSKTDPLLLQLLSIHSRYLDAGVRKACGIRCKKAQWYINSYYTIDRILLAPNTTYNIEEKFEYVNRVGYYVSEAGDPKIETNKCYDIKALTAPDPNSQSLIHLIYWISQSDSDIDSFKMDQDIEEKLSIFRADDIGTKLKEIYTEFGKLCRIYGREDLFFMYDLAFHSAISFNFQGQSIGKGWVEACVVGDSGVAKTASVKFLVKHYHAGEVMDGETTSEAGLKGGLHQGIGKSWQLQWGRIPINDRRLVVLDEASGIHLDIIANLSNIRSSGECIIQKIVSDKTRARTRLIWIANPRKNNTTVSNYTFGVDTVRDFFGKPEDVRRCDIATTAATGEIPVEVINKKHDDIVPRYTSELCSLLIRFAWSRTAEQIIITPEAEDMILAKSIDIGKKYSPVIPLVEAADMRNKIARLSVSLAIRVFNYHDGMVVVEPKHVEYICNWIDKIYAKPMFRYDAFSQKELRKTQLENPDILVRVLRLEANEVAGWTKYDALGNVNDLLDYSILEEKTLAMICGMGVGSSEFQRAMLKLKRCNAITTMSGNSIKINPSLIEFLRTRQSKLSSSTYEPPRREEDEMEEEF